MTLSLDDVRNKRFRMARKSGYEVLEVDEFVDEVEATFEQLFEENQNLKKQVESLMSSGPAGPGADGAATKAAPGRTPAAAVAPTQPAERIVVSTATEASSAVVRLVELTTRQSETLVAEASAEAAQIREQATTSADQLTSEAKARAERVQTEARTHAERLQADALGRAESLDREIETRRTEMFGDLEKQREQLTSTVQALRSFESTYRGNLTAHLRSQIEVLESGDAEPADPPAALADAPAARRNGGTGSPAAPRSPQPQAADRPAPVEDDTPTSGGGSASSDTPRLDALLGDQR